jgi:signal transduction histidine kinase
LAHNKALVQIQEMQAELFDIERRTLSSERSRISLELHDHVANKLAILLQQIRNGTIGQSEIDHDLNEITEDVRYLSHALSPFNEAADFEETLREWALHLQNKSGINIHIVNSASLDAISQELLVHIFRIIQEASSNSIKHGQAKNVFIQFMEHTDSVSLSIEDDGIGFNPEVQTSGLGLKHIKVRAQYLNAHFSIHSDANKGTFIQLIINQQPTQ